MPRVIDLLGHGNGFKMFRIQAVGYCPYPGAITDFRVQPVPQTAGVEYHWLAIMNVFQALAGGLGNNGAGGGFVALPRCPETGKENGRILPGVRWRDVVRRLAKASRKYFEVAAVSARALIGAGAFSSAQDGRKPQWECAMIRLPFMLMRIMGMPVPGGML